MSTKFVKKLQAKIVNKKPVNKSYEHKLWTEILNPSCKQKLLTKSCKLRWELNLCSKAISISYEHKLWPEKEGKSCKHKFSK